MTPRREKSKNRKRRTVVCDYKKNKFYFPQQDKCDKCDKCLIGEGHVEDISEIPFDPVHGALDCFRCEKCPAGFFSDRRRYKCKPCRVCSHLGRVEITSCSAKQNAKCGDRIPRYENTTKPLHPITQRLTGSSQNITYITYADNSPVSSVYISVFLLLGVAMLAAVITILFCRRRKKQLKDSSPVKFVNNKVKVDRQEMRERLLKTSNSASSGTDSVDPTQRQNIRSTASQKEETELKFFGASSNLSTSTQTNVNTTPATSITSLQISSLEDTDLKQKIGENVSASSTNMVPNLSIFNNNKEDKSNDKFEHWKNIGFKNVNIHNSDINPEIEDTVIHIKEDVSLGELSNFSFQLKSAPSSP